MLSDVFIPSMLIRGQISIQNRIKGEMQSVFHVHWRRVINNISSVANKRQETTFVPALSFWVLCRFLNMLVDSFFTPVRKHRVLIPFPSASIPEYSVLLLSLSHRFCLHGFQNKYKEDGKRNLSQSFYSQLPETTETQFAKSVAELQSEVRDTVFLWMELCSLSQHVFEYRWIYSKVLQYWSTAQTKHESVTS